MKNEHDQQISACYLFIANSIDWEPFTSGGQITETLAKHEAWLASPVTPYQKVYTEGDRVLFYVAGPKARHVVGDAVIAGPVSPMTEEDQQVANDLKLEGFEQRIPLRDVRYWNEPLALKPLVAQLTFIKDKQNWGLHLRQAATRIPYNDYIFLLKQAGITALAQAE